MKLCKETLNVLKNFSTINKGIQFLEGNEVRVSAIDKSVMGIAKIKETMPQDFAIYDLPMFLSVHSLFTEPELEFHDDYLIFKEGRRKVKYGFTDSRNVVGAPYDLELGSGERELFLSSTQLDSLKKASSIMQLNDFSIRKESDSITFNVEDLSQESNNNYQIELEETVDIDDFEVQLKMVSLNFLALDYDIELVNDNEVLVFTNSENNITYYVASEA